MVYIYDFSIGSLFNYIRFYKRISEKELQYDYTVIKCVVELLNKIYAEITELIK